MILGSGLVEISLVESEIGHTDLHTVLCAVQVSNKDID